MKFLEVIKYEGDNNTLVWKHPAEDFNTSSTLIVHESQEAIFLKNGQIADVFTAGRYVLKTENIPLLRKLMNIPTGGESTFHCEVYFVNKVEKMALKWGTDSKVQFIEPTYNFPMEIGASGEMSLQIADAAGFLVRLVGTETSISPEGLIKYFRVLLMSRVKSYLARTIKEQQLNIFEIDSQLDILSEAIKNLLVNDFAEYGVSLKQFFIASVVRPDDDPAYRKLKEITSRRYTDIFEEQTQQQVSLIRQQTESQMRIMEAQSLAEKRRLEGYTYQDERSFDVAEKVAGNESSGQFANLGIGMGMIAGIGGTMGGVVGNMVGGAMNSAAAPQPIQSTVQHVVEPATQTMESAHIPPTETVANPVVEEAVEGVICSCGAKLPRGAKFCFECGAKQAVRCINCGSLLVEGAKFCFECGIKV